MNNDRGVALIVAYMAVAFLGVLGSVFVAGSISESNNARRYAENERAFWISEGGMAQAWRNWVATGNPGAGGALGGGSYTVDTSALPTVVITGTFGNMSSQVTASFVRIPNAFSNTVSVGGDMSLTGLLARIEVFDRTRISGSFKKSGLGSSSWFQDMAQGVNPSLTTIPIPDFNANGTGDEFEDFVAFGRQAVQDSAPGEAVYIQNGGTVNIFPTSALVGTKVIFVEGTTAGSGDVNIFFDSTWRDGEDLTVISTGTISYIEPLQFQEDSRLSAVAWDDYNEVSVFRSQHESVVLARDDANFVDILDWGTTTGNIIVNDDMSLTEVLTYEQYYYTDRSVNGDMPPAFGLLGGSSGTPLFSDWRELS